jgi:serine/threonine protein kinase
MSIANDDFASFWSRPDLQSRRSVDLWCRHFEDLWQSQQRATIESIVDQAEAAIRAELTRELIAIEWELRQHDGESPVRTEYSNRFQAVDDLLDELEAAFVSDASLAFAAQAALRSLEPGTLFCGHRIIRELGRGAMGVVYLAELPTIGHQIALKILNVAHVEDPLIKLRFEREARLLSQLDHPGIVPLYSYGEDKGTRYLVMKAIHGISLAEMMFGQNPAGPVAQLLRDLKAPERLELIQSIAIQLTEAMLFVHQAGILHRDIKPSNVLLTDVGKVFLTDFSLARTEHVDSDLTSQHEFIGTLRYAAPESLDGVWTAQTDLYSLGLVLLELCTLNPSFATRTRRELLKQKLDDSLLQKTIDASSISVPLRRIVRKLTKFNPEDRYPSAVDVLKDLKKLDFNQPPAAPSLRLRSIAAGLLGLTVIGLLIFAATRNSSQTESDSPDVRSITQTNASGNFATPEERTKEDKGSLLRIAESHVVPLDISDRANVLTISDNGDFVLLSAAGILFHWNKGATRAIEIQKRDNARVILADVSDHGDVVFCTEEFHPAAASSNDGALNGELQKKSYGIAANIQEEPEVWGGFMIADFEAGFSKAQFVRGGPATERGFVMIPSAIKPAIFDVRAHKITNLPWRPFQLKMAATWESSLAVVTSNDMWILTSLREPDISVPAFPTEVKTPTNVHFLNDGQNLIVSSQRKFSLFSISTQQLVTTQSIPDGTSPVLSTPHKGSWLVFFGQRAVHVFDIAQNRWFPKPVETSDDILLAAPIAEEHLVVTVETSGRIRLTELTPEGTRTIHETTTPPLYLTAFSSCSHHLVVIDAEEKLRFFDIEPM